MSELSSHDSLIYLYVTKEGDYRRIFKALSEKEPFPEDISTCKSVIAKFVQEQEDENISITTVVDEDYPAVLKTRKCPPFIVLYQGNLKLLDKDQIIGLEDDMLVKTCNKHGLRNMYIDKDNTCVINIPEGDLGESVRLLEASRQEALFTLNHLATTCVATQGAEDFTNAVYTKGAPLKSNRQLFAIPGNSGCACNKLIKEGWHLCDTWTDLQFISAPDDSPTRKR